MIFDIKINSISKKDQQKRIKKKVDTLFDVICENYNYVSETDDNTPYKMHESNINNLQQIVNPNSINLSRIQSSYTFHHNSKIKYDINITLKILRKIKLKILDNDFVKEDLEDLKQKIIKYELNYASQNDSIKSLIRDIRTRVEIEIIKCSNVL